MVGSAHFCDSCRVPIIGDLCERCGRPSGAPKIPLRTSPVFEEELRMLADATGEPVDEFMPLELWAAGRFYYHQGRKIFRLVGGNLIENPRIMWTKNKKLVLSKLDRTTRIDEVEYRKRIREANRFVLGTLEDKCIEFIRYVADEFEDMVTYKAVSFSGGKDSAVVSALVRKALGNAGILHIFGDTTLENPDTLEFIDYFASVEKLFLLKAVPQQDFLALVDKALLPSRIHRWCCTAMKVAPIEKLLRRILQPGERILMFEGARREESLGRQKYGPLDLDFKIALEVVARPILEWSSLEEWLYILSTNLPSNNSYRKGFRRVGCSLCPLARQYSEFLMEYWSTQDRAYLPIWSGMKHALVRDLEKRSISPQDMKEYLKEGKWKGRAGGVPLSDYSKQAELSGWSEEHGYVEMELTRPFESRTFRGYFVPLWRRHDIEVFESQAGNRAILILSKEREMICKIVIQGQDLQLWWFAEKDKVYQQFLTGLRRQLVKYQFCGYCGGCETKCMSQAINVEAGSRYYLTDETRCQGCGRCIDIDQKGCLLAKSVRTTSSYRGI